MGCCDSTPVPLEHDRGIYDQLAEAIPLDENPSARHVALVKNNFVEEFQHPEGQPEKSLLVIAITHWKTGAWYK